MTNAGYDTINKIADANLDKFEADVKETLKAQGVRYSKSFIELDSANIIAKILPKVIEN